MQIHLVDMFNELTNAAKRQEWDVNLYPFTNIRDFKKLKNSAYVSPANSLCILNGGIDYIYYNMFGKEEIQNKVNKKLSEFNYMTSDNQLFLPIGMSFSVDIDSDSKLIVSPTMFIPMIVKDTDNAYHAFYSTLVEAKRIGIEHLITPGMCTGTGQMRPTDAIMQMKKAHQDFQSKYEKFIL